MSDHDRQDYVPPPAAPSMGWVSGTSVPNPKRKSRTELQESVNRHHREEEAERGRRPWWKRLFDRRSS